MHIYKKACEFGHYKYCFIVLTYCYYYFLILFLLLLLLLLLWSSLILLLSLNKNRSNKKHWPASAQQTWKNLTVLQIIPLLARYWFCWKWRKWLVTLPQHGHTQGDLEKDIKSIIKCLLWPKIFMFLYECERELT